MKTTYRWIIVILCMGFVTGILVFAWGSRARAQAAIEHLPERPEMNHLPPAFAKRADLIEQRIRSGTSPVGNLGTLGMLYHANGFPEEAVRVYEGLLDLEPMEARWWHRLAVIIAGYGYLEDAVPLWQEAVELAPDYVPARIRLADAWLKLNRFDEARAVNEAALEVEAGNPYALTGLARIESARGRGERAIAYLEEAAAQSANRVGVDLLAEAYREAGRPRDAIALGRETAMGAFVDIVDPWMDELLAECYDPERLANAGGVAVFRGEMVAGIRLLERATHLAPEDPYIRFQLGEACLQGNQFEQARRHFQRATDLQPTLADAWIRLVSLSLRAGDQAEAARLVFAGMENCPESPAMNMEMARFHESNGRLAAAIARLRKAIALRPNEAAAYLQLARIHFTRNEIDAGIEATEKALEAEPANAAALATLSLYAIQTGDRQSADRYLERVWLQPKVSADQVAQIEAAYEETFGEPPSSGRQPADGHP